MIFITPILYIISAILFVFGIKQLSKATTARRGNATSALGMLIAIIATLVGHGFQFQWIIVGALAGAIIGVLASKLVKMTAMPEMVALFNGFGGLASLLVGWGTYQVVADAMGVGWGVPALDAASAAKFMDDIGGGFSAATIYLAILIGGITFTGSIIAWGKLSGVVTQKPVLFTGQNVVNFLIVLAILVGAVWFTVDPEQYWIAVVATGVALVLGIMVVIPIGGADMPVVISLLNSYSGLAACAAGFVIRNNLLIITGALVGASGIILTSIMCKAMNRSLGNVLFSGFGAAGGSTGGSAIEGEAKPMQPSDAYYILEAASSVVVVPGYGMAVAQAQHAVRELAEMLEHNGTEVKYAIHPVAGRMPGHMNVLLAEANVSYDQLVEMDSINPTMETVDVAIVIGANDVVNPAAREDEGSPIYGMPIIDADKARTCFILKRSMASGFAGIDNPLFFRDNSYMIFGDAKSTVEGLVTEFKESAA
ncbi:MAG: NAD(P)(+) transhydrogenase (Re/Si-specific) subunit beta [Spirochaetaceae bacterium]|nr:NAD(P)(+) transhydrogenase (Re/Si-specific) subunit beta [Spirochaetaceae bacterium]